ncbi:cardiotrophin-like cytokine factor 1 [Salmo trutta]|nr:cardiotrophin-like cytokine factor 1 [Salmo trutta]
MHFEVHHIQRVLLLAAAVTSVQVPDPSFSLSNERTSIERTYELTKYLEHQLREIKDTYLSYLGPPFSDPDFSPPRPNSTALSLPSAATRLELWRGLENRARLAQNQRAYSVLLGAVRELARSTLCPYLQSSLLHFSTGLDGLLGSISGLMNTLGYALPPAGIEAQYPRRGKGGDGEATGRRPAPLMSQGLYKTGAGMGAGPRRHPLDDQRAPIPSLLILPPPPTPPLSLFYPFGTGTGEGHTLLSEPVPLSLRRGPPLLPPPPLSPLLSSSPLLAVRPALNDFSRKVEGFWVLRELQSWLWRSAKDFNRLKKRLRV